MNRQHWIGFGFVLVVAAQLAVPAVMIARHERTLGEGRVFKFRTRPVDPADAFRGRYVWVGLEPGSVKMANAAQWSKPRVKAFAVLESGPDGYATIKSLEKSPPRDLPFVAVRTTWCDTRTGEVHLQWPGLDRYYMTEKKAPDAERAYWDHNRDGNRACHVTVRVLEGNAVIEDLFIDGKRIRAWLSEHPNR